MSTHDINEQDAEGLFPSFGQFNICKNTVFRRRVQVLLVKIAIAVMSEPNSTENHNERVNFARKILRKPAIETANVAVGVVTQVDITCTTTDAVLAGAIEAIFNAYAG